jgi:hypothetical protein
MLKWKHGAAGLALALAGAAVAPAHAAMMGLDDPSGGPRTEPAQIYLPFPNPLNLFFFGGRDWCWYDGGWQGPGWYWCGYGDRYGYGYGGPEGFHGWREHRYERDWHEHGGGEGHDHHHDMGEGHEHHHEMGGMQHQQQHMNAGHPAAGGGGHPNGGHDDHHHQP